MEDTVKSNNEGYRTAFKSTSIFGGVKVVTVLIAIAKSKVMAVWLGTVGFGLYGMFNTIISLVSSISNLGLQSSAVREVANANGKEDNELLSKVVKSLNRWVLCTGLLGAIIMIAFSPLISRVVFETNDYIVSIVLLSSVVVLTGLYNQNYALLQGLRKIKLVAKANIFGALAAFVCSVPLFYFFREKGIVYALILSALSTFIVSFLYAKKVKLLPIDISLKESYSLGKTAITLGIMMTISSIVTHATEFIVKSYITREGGISDVGLYQAGWAINSQYLGIIFLAMSKDYFPRLSQCIDNHDIFKKSIKEQAEIAMLLLAPAIMGMIVFLTIIIKILYSGSFIDIVPMVKCLLVGSLLKAGSFSISYSFLAKGDGKIYLRNEVGINMIMLPLYILGYHWYGLLGIGFAFILVNLVYFVIVYFVAKKNYNVSYPKSFWKLFIVFTIFILSYLLFDYYLVSNLIKYSIGVFYILLISFYSLFELRKRMI